MKILEKIELDDGLNFKATLEGTVLDMMFLLCEFPRIKIYAKSAILREILKNEVENRKNFFKKI